MPSGKTKATKPSAKKANPSAPATASSTPGTPLAPAAALAAAADHPTAAVKPAPYDPAAAKVALETLRPRLLAIPTEKLSVPRLDVRAAALAALGVHAYVTEHTPLRSRFEKLHEAGEMEIANLAGLKDAAFVVLLTFAQAEAAGAFATEVKVAAAVVEQAMGVERRMQELLEYMFKKDPQVAPLLAVLRPGTGYRDLAADLIGYDEIYERHEKDVAADTTNYQPTDLADARRLAGEILSGLSAAMSPKAREAYDLLQRAWTWLLQVYSEVSEAGRWLLRYDPRREERFPSLFAAGRPRGGRPSKKAKPGEASPPEK